MGILRRTAFADGLHFMGHVNMLGKAGKLPQGLLPTWVP